MWAHLIYAWHSQGACQGWRRAWLGSGSRAPLWAGVRGWVADLGSGRGRGCAALGCTLRNLRPTATISTAAAQYYSIPWLSLRDALWVDAEGLRTPGGDFGLQGHGSASSASNSSGWAAVMAPPNREYPNDLGHK